MLKKAVSLFLALALVLSLASCGPKETEAPAPAAESAQTEGQKTAEESKPAEPEKPNYKIGIITGTVSQGEEEYRAAEKMKEKFGDMIITQTYPDKFMTEQETTIANTLSIAADPDVKAIVFVQAVPGASAAIDKVREKRPDMFFVAGVPAEDPDMIASKADVVFQADELGMGDTVINQAELMGAKTFVHYSFPRHMSYQLLSARRDLFKKNCEAKGITFVDATAPDPTSDAGVSGAQQFILEDVPKKVKEYGKDTAFFSTNCSMQEPLIKSVLEQGAIFPQQCCPSPYHGLPGALGIEIPEDKKGDVAYVTEEIRKKVAEMGGTGRVSTWPVPINMIFVEGGVEYAMAYLDGKTNGKVDKAKVEEIFTALAGKPMTINTYTSQATGAEVNNFFMVLSEYLTF